MFIKKWRVNWQSGNNWNYWHYWDQQPIKIIFRENAQKLVMGVSKVDIDVMQPKPTKEWKTRLPNGKMQKSVEFNNITNSKHSKDIFFPIPFQFCDHSLCHSNIVWFQQDNIWLTMFYLYFHYFLFIVVTTKSINNSHWFKVFFWFKFWLIKSFFDLFYLSIYT